MQQVGPHLWFASLIWKVHPSQSKNGSSCATQSIVRVSSLKFGSKEYICRITISLHFEDVVLCNKRLEIYLDW